MVFLNNCIASQDESNRRAANPEPKRLSARLPLRGTLPLSANSSLPMMRSRCYCPLSSVLITFPLLYISLSLPPRAFQRHARLCRDLLDFRTSCEKPPAPSHPTVIILDDAGGQAAKPGGGGSGYRCPDYFRKERSACREERPEGRPKDRRKRSSRAYGSRVRSQREREREIRAYTYARVHAKGYIEREGEQITAGARGREAAVGVRGWFLGRRAAGES